MRLGAVLSHADITSHCHSASIITKFLPFKSTVMWQKVEKCLPWHWSHIIYVISSSLNINIHLSSKMFGQFFKCLDIRLYTWQLRVNAQHFLAHQWKILLYIRQWRLQPLSLTASLPADLCPGSVWLRPAGGRPHPLCTSRNCLQDGGHLAGLYQWFYSQLFGCFSALVIYFNTGLNLLNIWFKEGLIPWTLVHKKTNGFPLTLRKLF